MTILKQKIARVNALKASQNDTLRAKPLPSTPQNFEEQNKEEDLPSKKPILKKRRRVPGASLTPENTRSTKNIVKNFGRAICTFAVSHLATPYLEPLLQENKVSFDGFTSHMNKLKANIDGLFKFRSLLMDQPGDTNKVGAYKRLFKAISEVFIKYFSVNWIFHGKVFHKEAHLKFRFKMLRRIKSPENFTYLKKGKKVKKETRNENMMA